MQRGEVWWAEFDERRPVVLLSGDAESGFQAMQIVPPSGVDLTGLGIEVAVGPIEGVPYEGVLRLAFPHPDFLFCTWLTTLTPESLIEPAGELSAAKLQEIDEALRLSEREQVPDPDATMRLREIADALRRGSTPQ
jgi:mRNA interferase MazF